MKPAKNFQEFVRRLTFCAVRACPNKDIQFEHHPTRGSRGNIDHDRGWNCCSAHHRELDAPNGGRATFQKKYRLDLNRYIDFAQARYLEFCPNGKALVQVEPWRERGNLCQSTTAHE